MLPLRAFALIALTVPACLPPTEIAITVTTDETCGALTGDAGSTPQTYLYAGNGAVFTHPMTSVVSNLCGDGGYLGTFVAIPNGTGDPVDVLVVTATNGVSPDTCFDAGAHPDCLIQRRQYAFMKHEPVTATIALPAVCAGNLCDETTTCVGAHVCVPFATRCDDTGCDAGK